MKKIIWIVVFLALAFGLWKAGVYFYRQMEQEEAKRNLIMEKQSQSAAESITAPATSGMEHKASEARKKLDQINQERNE